MGKYIRSRRLVKQIDVCGGLNFQSMADLGHKGIPSVECSTAIALRQTSTYLLMIIVCLRWCALRKEIARDSVESQEDGFSDSGASRLFLSHPRPQHT